MRFNREFFKTKLKYMEITGLNAEETYLAEKTLDKEGFITVEVDTQGIKGTADKIMSAIIWGDKKEFWDSKPF